MKKLSQLVRIALIFFFFFPFLMAFNSRSWAGLSIQFSEDISVSSISRVSRSKDDLHVIYEGGIRTIYLPRYSLDHLIDWVDNGTSGPVVFSMDGSLVGYGLNYAPEGVSSELADLMFFYDSYAHMVSTGGLATGIGEHPLKRRVAFPDRQAGRLLNRYHKNDRAAWYRKVASSYVLPAACVGEIDFLVEASGKAYPLAVKPKIKYGFVTERWYRTQDVCSSWDQWAFSIPYQPLKNHIENKWFKYKKAFPPLGEADAIAEAFVLLSLVRSQKPEQWESLRKTAGPLKRRPGPFGSNPLKPAKGITLSPTHVPVKEWIKNVIAGIGDKVETLAEANIALELIVLLRQVTGDGHSEIEDQLYPQIIALAEGDETLRAKLVLDEILSGKEPKATSAVKVLEFIDLVQAEDRFRLRVDGFFRLRSMGDSLGLQVNFEVERQAILNEFLQKVPTQFSQPTERDFLFWEDLSQDVYSTPLLHILAEEYGADSLPPPMAEAIARIHFGRGTAFQIGDEFWFTHAHFRYLGYLENRLGKVTDESLSQLFNAYFKELEQRMRDTNLEPLSSNSIR